MAELKRKGDLAELRVAADLVRQGHRVAFPFGEDCDCDVLVDRGGGYERVQVKHAASDGLAIHVKCVTHSLTNGRVRAVKRYTAATIDWLAVWDATSEACCYVPAAMLGAGRRSITLRLQPPSYDRRKDVRYAADYARMPRRPRIELALGP